MVDQAYENAFTEALDTVAYEGWIAIPKWKIIRWYNKDNFSINIRRDIRDQWNRLMKKLHWNVELRIAEIGGDIILMKKTDFFPDKE